MPRQSCGPAAVIGGCSAVILFFMLLAQGIVGGKYIGYCPGQPFIPVYLAVMGGGFLPLILQKCVRVCFLVVSVFYFFWFLAGNVCIYILYNMEYRDCNNTLYLFAFWSTNFTYVVLGVMFCSLCCDKLGPDTGEQAPLLGSLTNQHIESPSVSFAYPWDDLFYSDYDFS